MPDSLKLRSLAVTMADEPAVRADARRIRDGFAEVVGRGRPPQPGQRAAAPDVEASHVVALFAGLSFLGAFTCALGGDRSCASLGPVAETLLQVLTPTDRETT